MKSPQRRGDAEKRGGGGSFGRESLKNLRIRAAATEAATRRIKNGAGGSRVSPLTCATWLAKVGPLRHFTCRIGIGYAMNRKLTITVSADVYEGLHGGSVDGGLASLWRT